jgi:hypothetical protein
MKTPLIFFSFVSMVFLLQLLPLNSTAIKAVAADGGGRERSNDGKVLLVDDRDQPFDPSTLDAVLAAPPTTGTTPEDTVRDVDSNNSDQNTKKDDDVSNTIRNTMTKNDGNARDVSIARRKSSLRMMMTERSDPVNSSSAGKQNESTMGSQHPNRLLAAAGSVNLLHVLRGTEAYDEFGDSASISGGYMVVGARGYSE